MDHTNAAFGLLADQTYRAHVRPSRTEQKKYPPYVPLDIWLVGVFSNVGVFDVCRVDIFRARLAANLKARDLRAVPCCYLKCVASCTRQHGCMEGERGAEGGKDYECPLDRSRRNADAQRINTLLYFFL